jgi:hypothetical protein
MMKADFSRSGTIHTFATPCQWLERRATGPRQSPEIPRQTYLSSCWIGLPSLNSLTMSKYIIVIVITAVTAVLAAAPAPSVTEVKSPAAPDSLAPNLAVAADGRVFMSWIEPGTPNGHVLRFSVRGPQGWSAPKTIARGTNWFVSAADVPSMAVMQDGTLAAHWFVKPAGVGPESESYDINLAFSKDGGGTWSKPIVPHRDAKKRQHGFVSLIPTPDGKLNAIWLDGRNMANEEEGDMALMYTTIAPSGALSPEVQIDNRACECCQTAMATTPDGLIAIYRDRSDKEIRDISVVRYANGRWSQPEALTKDGWEIDGCPINGPSVSSNGRNVAVAWFTAPDDKPQVNVLMSNDSGKTFGKKIRVDDGNPVGRVGIVSRASGAAVVSWVERSGQGPQVRIREIAANGTADAPVNVSGTAGLGSGAFPRMARSGEDIVVAWTDGSKPAQLRTAVVK